jgi:GNAT superfamily N-acetyltransferase
MTEAPTPSITDHIRLVTFTAAQAESEGHDVTDIADVPIKRLWISGAWLDFDQSDRMIRILTIGTEPAFRRQGLATRLLIELAAISKSAGCRVDVKAYTPDGARYLAPLCARLFAGGPPVA